MDGLFHGKPYEQMDDLGGPLFFETPISVCHNLAKWFIPKNPKKPSRSNRIDGRNIPSPE